MTGSLSIFIDHSYYLLYFSKNLFMCVYMYVFIYGGGREKEMERNRREKEAQISCLLYVPWPGTHLPPRHVPWPKIQSSTLHFVRCRPTNWATLVRAIFVFSKCDYLLQGFSATTLLIFGLNDSGSWGPACIPSSIPASIPCMLVAPPTPPSCDNHKCLQTSLPKVP